MSPNERLNNIILERTIEYNTTQLKIPRQKNPTLPLRSRAHGKKDQSPHGLLTAQMFVTSYHMSQLRYQFPSRDMPLQKLSGVAIFASLQECIFSSL